VADPVLLTLAEVDVGVRPGRQSSELMKDDVEDRPVVMELPANAKRADPTLVDGVVGQIRGILALTVSRGMDEVGQLLLREFFDNNPTLYSSVSPTKHASLRLLMDRCETMDLPVRRTFLANALQLAVFTRNLPESSVFLQLPPSHRIELLRLRSADRAESLAAAAVEKKMTVKRVRDAVRKEREKTKSSRGRKPAPPIMKAIAACVKALRDESTGRLCFRRDDVTSLDPEQLLETRSMAANLSKRMDELAKLLD
jgi:hypothetical protein